MIAARYQAAATVLLLCLALTGYTSTQASPPVDNIVVTDHLLFTETGLTNTIVLDERTLKQLDKKSLPDILRTVPGLQVNTQGGAGGLSSISIRGSEPNFLAVYIDDIKVNDPSSIRGSGFNFHDINPANIRHIEVIKGPASVIHGADAMAGVIRIYTHPSAAVNQQRLTNSTSAKGDYLYGYSMAGSGTHTGISINAATQQTRNKQSGNDFASNELNIQVSHQYLDNELLNIQLRHSSNQSLYYPEQSGGPELAESDELEKNTSSQSTFSLSSQNQLRQNWRSDIRLSHFRRDSTLDSPGISPYTSVPPFYDEASYAQTTLNWTNRVAVNNRALLQFGAEQTYESGESKSLIDMGGPVPLDYTLKRNNSALYAHTHLHIPGNWEFSAGIRQDQPEHHDHHTSRQLNIKAPCLMDTLCLQLNWGEGFKLPGFSALAHPLIGNPDLAPETSESRELHILLHTSFTQAVEISLFENDYRNMINFDSDQFQTVNRDRIETSGIDISLVFDLADTLETRLYGNRTTIDTHGSNAVLTGRAKHTAGLLLHWQVAETLGLQTDLQYNGRQVAETQHTGTATSLELPAYRLLNFRLDWQADMVTSVQLAIDNLLDHKYYETVGTPSSGRTAYIGIQSSW